MSEAKVIYDWANPQEAAKVIAEVRREALMEAAKAVCKDCKYGDLPEKLKKDEGKIHGIHYKKGDFVHRSKDFGNFIMCEANEIHKLIDDQGQDQQPDGEERKV